MSSKRRQRQRGCINKRKFRTVWEARRAASRTTQKTGWKASGYHCANCGFYHQGHAPQRVQIKLSEKGIV